MPAVVTRATPGSSMLIMRSITAVSTPCASLQQGRSVAVARQHVRCCQLRRAGVDHRFYPSLGTFGLPNASHSGRNPPDLRGRELEVVCGASVAADTDNMPLPEDTAGDAKTHTHTLPSFQCRLMCPLASMPTSFSDLRALEAWMSAVHAICTPGHQTCIQPSSQLIDHSASIQPFARRRRFSHAAGHSMCA